MEAAEAPERVSKKQRIEQTQEAVAQLAGLMKTTLEGMQALHDTLKMNTEQQQEMKAEIDALAKQMGSDAITAKVVYTSLADFQRTQQCCMAALRPEKGEQREPERSHAPFGGLC